MRDSAAHPRSPRKALSHRWWVWATLAVILMLLVSRWDTGTQTVRNAALQGPQPVAPPAGPAQTGATDDPATESSGDTDAAVLSDVQTFIDERAASGVLFARTVADLSLDDGVLRATYDPEGEASMDPETFLEIKAYENLAEFVGLPLCFDGRSGERIRTQVVKVETQLTDGTSLGTSTAAMLYHKCTGEPLK